ncbi:MAG: 3-phosphoshikimate 1-carboxyvinyltransferase, partial [Acidobacteria bacterium]|nr:3-phosphoshikimate 1-carboxyvinyltransferase [Acidobacteriota bacterium]
MSATNFLTIEPIRGPLRARARVPGSKSLTNRVLVASALADRRTTLTGALIADDSRHMAGALAALGIGVTIHAEQCRMVIDGALGRIPARAAELRVGNSGTTARFLTAVLTLGDGEYVIDGEPRMRERPIGGLVDALVQLGATIECSSGCPPVRIVARGLRGGRARVSGAVSSQFLSAILLAAPCARMPVEVVVEGELRSKPYVDMTVATLASFGIEVARVGFDRFRVNPGPYRSPGTYQVEADASAASYLFAAAAIVGGSVRVEGLTRRSLQGDIRFVDILSAMGCRVRDGDTWTEVCREGALRGVDVDLGDMPDVAQTLAAVAPFAESPTTIRGIASARLKECDRIAASAEALARLGVTVSERPDGLVIEPCARLRPAVVPTRDDHRMAMAFALVGLGTPGVTIENPGCVSKTFPGFFAALDHLREPSVDCC